MLQRRTFMGVIGGAALAWPASTRAQATHKMARIGIVSIGSPTADMTGALPRNSSVRAFLRGMAELGYVFGRDFVSEPRGTDDISRVAELVDHKVDMIVATGGGKTLSLLKQVTKTVPIIMTAAQDDPVNQGFVQSLARPATNFTGMSLLSLALTAKRLQILGELVPDGVRTTAVFWDPTLPELWPIARAYGETQGWKLLSVEIRDPSEIPTAFKTAVDAGARALLVPASGLLFSRASQIADLAALNRLPAMYELRPVVDAGGLISYGADIEDIWRRAATYVDKILKGANPAELPVEQPTKFELAVNMRAAKALNLTIPPSILILANQIVE
jgi:putative tryptophan/tyrosine transport system substrate-binding protein